MKIKILFAFLLMFALCSQGQMTITVKMAAMPYNVNTEAVWLQNAIGAGQTGSDVYDPNGGNQSTTPYAYQTAPAVITNPGYFVASSGFNSWMGQVNPASPFGSQNGLEWDVIIHIQDSSQQFSFWNLVVNLSSSDPNDMFGQTFDFNNNTESYAFVNGENYSTGVDFLRPNGNALNELDLVVPCSVWNASLMSGTTPQQQMAQEEAQICSSGSFSITATATEYNSGRTGILGSGSDTTMFEPAVVPEASSVISLLIGLGIILINRPTKRQSMCGTIQSSSSPSSALPPSLQAMSLQKFRRDSLPAPAPVVPARQREALHSISQERPSCASRSPVSSRLPE